MHTVRPSSKHIIFPIQLSGFENETILASSYGNGNKKRLILHTFITASDELVTEVRVINQNITVYHGSNLKDAIEEYNKY